MENPRYKVALFGGCAQDFVYPEQLEAAVKVLAAHGVAVDYPELRPAAAASGDDGTASRLEGSCPSECGSLQLRRVRRRYYALRQLRISSQAQLYGNSPGRPSAVKAQSFADKVTDFSSFIHDVLGLGPDDFNNNGEKTTYHAACHICRGLGVREAPRALIADAADYVPCNEEEVCCGFGGSYSMKFPEISGPASGKETEQYRETGASRVVMDCPGCIMQIRGGVEKRNMDVKVSHIAELLAENMKI